MSDGTEAPESLTGVWHGQYTYPMGLMPPAAFMATLIDVSGTLSGSTNETTEQGGKNATLDGARDGGAVRFVKTYSPASEEFQDVIYIGTLSSDRTEIEGEWIVPGVWQGKFLMIRARAQGKQQSVSKRKKLDA